LVYNGMLVLILAAVYAIGMRLNLVSGSAAFGLAGDWFLVTLFVLGAALSRLCAMPLEWALARRRRVGWVVGAHVIALVFALLLTSFSLAIFRTVFRILGWILPGGPPDLAALWDTSGSAAGYLTRALASMASTQLLLVVPVLLLFAIVVPSKPGWSARERRRRVDDGEDPRVGARQAVASTYVGMFTGIASLAQGFRAEWLSMSIAAAIGILGAGALLVLGRRDTKALVQRV
jgi:hypothetical protein